MKSEYQTPIQTLKYQTCVEKQDGTENRHHLSEQLKTIKTYYQITTNLQTTCSQNTRQVIVNRKSIRASPACFLCISIYGPVHYRIGDQRRLRRACA